MHLRGKLTESVVASLQSIDQHQNATSQTCCNQLGCAHTSGNSFTLR